MFTNPCVVRVENLEERKELLEWLTRIGYHDDEEYPSRDHEKEIHCFGNTYLCIDYEDEDYGEEDDSLDGLQCNCGTNIPLFKALAAMNDKNDYMQLFRVLDCANGQHRMVLCTKTDAGDFFLCPPESIRKSTEEELIEHFKTK